MNRIIKTAATVSAAALLAACSSSRETNYTAQSDQANCRDQYSAANDNPNDMAQPTGPVAPTPIIVRGERTTDLPGHYSNASPSGFDNSSAWSRSGTTPEVR